MREDHIAEAWQTDKLELTVFARVDETGANLVHG